MILSWLLKKSQARNDDSQVATNLNDKIIKIQSGDIELRNQVLSDYQPFIVKVSSKVCKRFIDPNKDDEFSIALSAFNEAMNSFNQIHNTSFLTFAETVVKRRLIDYLRKESKYQNQVPMTTFDILDEDENVMNPIEVKQSIDVFNNKNEAEDRKEEILRYVKVIEEFGISFSELVHVSPKHQDARQNLFNIAEILVKDEEMVKYLMEKKTLPIKQLLPKVTVSRKTIERNRKYLIAIVIIKVYEFHYLKDYLNV